MIRLADQYIVERERNNKYQWLCLGLFIASFFVHGLLFHWIPNFLRNRRDPTNLKNTTYFKLIAVCTLLNGCIGIKIPFRGRKFYFQPSLILLGLGYCAIIARFSYMETIDITYEPQFYIIGKRLGRLAVAQLPHIYLLVTKNDFISALSGLQHDRLVLIHKWISRLTWLLATIHLYYTTKYWLDLGLNIMINIPPQYFGMIAYACMCFLSWASLRVVRILAYDFFLVQHRVFSFIMLLFVFFHAMVAKSGIILAVHLLVLDRIVSRIVGIIQKAKSPTKGISKFEVFDNETMLVTIPITKNPTLKEFKWHHSFIPQVGNWKAGQHVYLNVSSVNGFQWHPFTICSLSRTGEIKLLIKKQKGFTKKLMNKLLNIQEEMDGVEKEEVESTKFGEIKKIIAIKLDLAKEFIVSKVTFAFIALINHVVKPMYKSFKNYILRKNPNDQQEGYKFEDDEYSIKLKSAINGPYGANIQPLLTFDTALFLSTGSGGSFTFPIALDLLEQIQARNVEGDFLFRPGNARINIVWSIKYIQNLIWYKHIIDDLIPFLEQGKAKFTIYITRSQQQINICSCKGASKEQKEYGCDIKLSQVKAQKQTEIVTSKSGDSNNEKNSNELKITSKSEISNTSCDTIEENENYVIINKNKGNYQYAEGVIKSGLIKVIYSRMDVKEIIAEETNILASQPSGSSKSLAVLGCGPEAFSDKIKAECQRNRWAKGSPDIYCCNETF